MHNLDYYSGNITPNTYLNIPNGIPGPPVDPISTTDPSPETTQPDGIPDSGNNDDSWALKLIPATLSLSVSVNGHIPTPLFGTGPGGHIGLSANWITKGENAAFLPKTLSLDFGGDWDLDMDQAVVLHLGGIQEIRIILIQELLIHRALINPLWEGIWEALVYR